jgi:hypothetical protein
MHRRTITVVVVAVAARTVVVARTRSDVDHHPRFGARPVPVEANRLEVLEGGEAVELAAHFVVRHDGECAVQVEAVGRDVDGDSLDTTRIDPDILFGVIVAEVGLQEDVDVTLIGVVSDVLHVVVDRDRAVVIHHHRL